MSFSPIRKIEGGKVVGDNKSWYEQYKEAFVEHYHDVSQLTLVHPDDCLIVAGPPRLSQASGEDDMHPIGFINQLQYSETRNVQPMKAIGSRRHVFSATNAPVQGSIGRMMILGRNILNSLYTKATFGEGINSRNTKFRIGEGDDASWWTNIEEDVFRVPFGLGVIYNSPASMSSQGSYSAGADYIEVCTLTSRQSAVQSGQTMIMEQVGFMADRVVPWTAYGSIPTGNLPETVTNSTDME